MAKEGQPPKQTLDAFVLVDGIICSHIVNLLTTHSVRAPLRLHLSLLSGVCIAHCIIRTTPTQCAHTHTHTLAQWHAECISAWTRQGFLTRLHRASLSLQSLHKPATFAARIRFSHASPCTPRCSRYLVTVCEFFVDSSPLRPAHDPTN